MSSRDPLPDPAEHRREIPASASANPVRQSRPRPARRAKVIDLLRLPIPPPRARNSSPEFFPACAYTSTARSKSLSIGAARPGGDGPPPQRLARSGQLAAAAVVHGVVRRLAERNQIPSLPGKLGVILSRPDVVHMAGLLASSVSLRPLASVAGLAEDALAEPEPAAAGVIKSHDMQKARARVRPSVGWSWALALVALAAHDVDQNLTLAFPAPGWQMLRLGGREGLDELAAAEWAAHETAFFCHHSSTILWCLQHFHPLIPKII